MKLNAMLFSAALAAGSMLSANVYADNTTRVAAASALGSVAGTAIGKNMGGTTGATIGAALGGAGGAAVASNKRHRTESAIGGALGGGAGAALGNKISKDKEYDRYQERKWKKKRNRR